MSTPTTNYGLTKPAPEDFYDINVDNSNLDKIDQELKAVNDKADSNRVRNLGFRGLLADEVAGVGPVSEIGKYPEGVSGFYTDKSDWAVYLNMQGFSTTEEFLFIETHKTVDGDAINAVQVISRYKKESTGVPVELVESYRRAWYSDPSYTGWSNAIKTANAADLATHQADEVAHITAAERTAWDGAVTDIGDKTTLQTTSKANLVSAINEVFQSGNNVKVDMVDTLLSVDPSLPITHDSTWAEIETATEQISTGKELIPGDVILWANNPTKSNSTGSWTNMKVIQVGENGVFRVSFEMQTGTSGYPAEAQIYVNGIAKGILRSNPSNAYTKYVEDIELKNGDTLQLRAKSNNSGFTVYVQNLTIGIEANFVNTVV